MKISLIVIICAIELLSTCLSFAQHGFSPEEIKEKIRTQYDPIPPEKRYSVIVGIKSKDVEAIFHKKCNWCCNSHSYIWNIPNISMQSYSEKEDDIFLLEIFGAGITDGSRQPETMPKIIGEISEVAKITCSDDSRKSEYAKMIRDKLTKLAYAKTGQPVPKDPKSSSTDKCWRNEDFLISDNVHIYATSYNEDRSSQVKLVLTGAAARIWTDKTGKFKVAASYLSNDSKQVKLIKEDGSEIKVPLANLSVQDNNLLCWLDGEYGRFLLSPDYSPDNPPRRSTRG